MSFVILFQTLQHSECCKVCMSIVRDKLPENFPSETPSLLISVKAKVMRNTKANQLT